MYKRQSISRVLLPVLPLVTGVTVTGAVTALLPCYRCYRSGRKLTPSRQLEGAYPKDLAALECIDRESKTGAAMLLNIDTLPGAFWAESKVVLVAER